MMISNSKLGRYTVAFATAIIVGCAPAENARHARSTLVIGVDVSGSFQSTGNYEQALDFAAHYLYGHLNGLGNLTVPSAVFVGSVGGEIPGETKSFQPISAFRGKSVAEIAARLRETYPSEDSFTDFNAFFDRVTTLVKRQNLILAPLNVVLLTDGIPDVTASADNVSRYSTIDLGSLEYLSRSVTVRVLYASPTVAVSWERDVERRRVRIWTVDDQVMRLWPEQMDANVSTDSQDELWKWMLDNVDFRVRSRVL